MYINNEEYKIILSMIIHFGLSLMNHKMQFITFHSFNIFFFFIEYSGNLQS